MPGGRVFVIIAARFFKGGSSINRDLLINDEIRARSVRVIDDNGTQLGVLPIDQARLAASQKELDLVLIAPEANPPVAKILDYGRYRYELVKKDKESRKHQRKGLLKELKMSPKIGLHDFEVRVKQAKSFLAKGHKVKVVIFFRGREVTHADLGFALLDKFIKTVNEGMVEFGPVKEGRFIILTMMPK